MIRCSVVALAFVAWSVGAAQPAAAQAEYRAFWVDTFNTALNNHAQVVAVVNQAQAANANVIFAQVRRRGDAWYLNSLEPLPHPNPIATGFDPLQDLIAESHAAGLEVHAFVIMGAIWNRDPVVLGPPADPTHVFNRHGGFDPVTKTITQGPDNWLTRTLLSGFAFQGHRFGSDFWIDFGHPDAAAYTVDVLMHLVNNYDVDGLHLDRIRYPEFSASGQTPANGTNIGYNHTNVVRFNRHYGITPEDLPPATGDARWTEEGILDLAIPMNYKREHILSQQTPLDQWLEWTRDHQYGRAALMGQGAFVNGIEGTLRQVRRSLAPSASTGRKLDGVVFFSMADPSRVWPPNGQQVTVTLSGDATDVGTGVSSIAFRVIDEYGEVEPAVPPIAGAGTFMPWSRQLQLHAARRGSDRDGRTYTIEATVTDGACHTKVATATVVVAHDQRASDR